MKQVKIDIDKLEFLCSCLDNQKDMPVPELQSDSEKSIQEIIDQANREVRCLLSSESVIVKQIREALDRGYCHEENKDKELDGFLIDAMVEELMCSSVQFSLHATIMQE